MNETVKRTFQLALVLAAAVIGWLVLSQLAHTARDAGVAVEKQTERPTTADYTTAKEWATALLGLAATIAGFFGITAASRGGAGARSITDRAQSAETGMVGVLGGATLLGAGGTAVPVALALLVAGGAAVRTARVVWRQQDG